MKHQVTDLHTRDKITGEDVLGYLASACGGRLRASRLMLDALILVEGDNDIGLLLDRYRDSQRMHEHVTDENDIDEVCESMHEHVHAMWKDIKQAQEHLGTIH